MGISDEYTGKSKIKGDLVSLDKLTKLRKVSLYNMDITNCRRFSDMHPTIEGGCSKESQSTLADPNKIAERSSDNKTREGRIQPPAEKAVAASQDSSSKRNFLDRVFNWLRKLFA